MNLFDAWGGIVGFGGWFHTYQITLAFLLLLRGTRSEPCAEPNSPDPWRITPGCVDPEYDTPVIDGIVDLDTPVAHRRISGHFNGTGVDFNFYLPPESQWQGRFFSYVYPTQNSTASNDHIGFAIDSGGYLIQIKGTSGYRADAAAAKLSRSVLGNHYEKVPAHVFGYIFGGSGGSFQSIGAIENTEGIWDGAVPIVIATSVSVPNSLTVVSLASLVLRNKSSVIASTIRAGGTELDTIITYLDDIEAAVLREATLMGVPVEAWENLDGLSSDSSSMLETLRVRARDFDPSYAEDYWTQPGYLGTENSRLADIIHSNFSNHTAVVKQILRDTAGNATAFELDDIPNGLANTIGLEFRLYDTNGTALGLFDGTLDNATNTLALAEGYADPALGNLNSSLRLQIDNSWFVALQTYHRHQLPTRPGFHGFDQFRNANGTPIYPQREVNVASLLASLTSGGGSQTGNITGKVMVVDNLLDSDAFPWHADWYKSQVQSSLGERFGDNFRLYFNERADHFFGPIADNLRDFIVDYSGIYEHALRSLALWVEEGTLPPESTEYQLNQSQVTVPPSAKERFGIQPIVNLTVASREVQRESEVTFNARFEAPHGAGKIVLVEWDFLGNGSFEAVSFGQPRELVEVASTYRFPEPGVYLTVARVTSQREGDAASSYALARNMGRVQMTVL